MTAEILSSCEGFGLGYQYTLSKGKEEEVLQGKNYYLATLFQTGEIAALCALVQKVAATIFQIQSASLSIISNLAPLAWLPIGILLASVKQNQYTGLVDYFSNSLAKVLPRTLSTRTIKVLNFITEHTSTLVKVAVVVSTASLAYFGLYAYCGAIAGVWGYHEIDRRGYVPRKISLFVETYLPLVANACLLVCGSTVILQAFAAVNLITLFPYTNQFLTHKIDTLARYCFSIKGISLAEYESPLIERSDLSFEEINQILDGENFEINPAHCSKFVHESFPKDPDFDKFLQLFNEISWEKKYALVQKKLKDDERFCDFLREQFPGKDPKTDFDALIEALANGQPKEAYVAKWMQEQLFQMVKTLKGEVRAKGEQKDLDIGIDHCAMIIAYLQKPDLTPIEKEDILLKLAVEGGEYCARAIKRSSGEIVNENIVPSGLPSKSDDPQKNYELKIKQALQNKRRDIIQNSYRQIVNMIKIPDAVSQDVHGFDIYRLFLSLGFYPLSSRERKDVGLAEIAVWGLYNEHRRSMLNAYSESLDEVVHEQGELQFSQYIRNYIHTNRKLTEDQKETLMDKYTTANDDRWTVEETNQRFHRLMLVKLGILKEGPSMQRRQVIKVAKVA